MTEQEHLFEKELDNLNETIRLRLQTLVKKYREDNKFTYEQLYQNLGIGRSTLTAVLAPSKRNYQFSVRTILKIVKAVDKSICINFNQREHVL